MTDELPNLYYTTAAGEMKCLAVTKCTADVTYKYLI